MKPTSHHAPEEMHNDDTAHEHSDINVGALIVVDGRDVRHGDR